MTKLKQIKRNHIQTPPNPQTLKRYFFALLWTGEATDTCDLQDMLYCSLLYVDFHQKNCLFLRAGLSHPEDLLRKTFYGWD